jgi:hypothetical protein
MFMYGFVAGVSSAFSLAPTFFDALDEGIYATVGAQKKEWKETAKRVAFISLLLAGAGWAAPFFDTESTFAAVGTLGAGIGGGVFYLGSSLTDRIHTWTEIDFSGTSLEGIASFKPNASQRFQECMLLANIVMKIGLVVIGGWSVLPALGFDLIWLGRLLMQNNLCISHIVTPFTSSSENPPQLLGYRKWVAHDCEVRLHFPEFSTGKPGFAAIQLSKNPQCQMTEEELKSYIEHQAQRVAEAVKKSIKLLATDVYQDGRYSHTSYKLEASCDSIMIDSPVPGGDPIPLEQLLPEITCTIYVGPNTGTRYADTDNPLTFSKTAKVVVKSKAA